MTVEAEEFSSARRRLILRDAATFLSLIAVTAALFTITLFLFRSFEAHRGDLARRWSDRGRSALTAGQPQEAIADLRTALSYAPDERPYELLLAQALGEAGHVEESFNYFLGLWETTPGDGWINLNLARLAAERHDTQAAINYYQASIYGTWEGDAVLRRREVRLELARYMIAQHDAAGARSELLIAAGNNPNDVGLRVVIAQMLEQVDAPNDALNYYKKILAQEPGNETALVSAGRLEYDSGNFEEANRLLKEAVKARKDTGQGEDVSQAETMRENSERILMLTPRQGLTPIEQAERILKAREIAKRRFDSCNQQTASASGLATPLKDLGARWMSTEGTVGRTALAQDAEQREDTMNLIFDTEVQTNTICGAPSGDDALLLLLAKHPNAMEQ